MNTQAGTGSPLRPENKNIKTRSNDALGSAGDMSIFSAQ